MTPRIRAIAASILTAVTMLTGTQAAAAVTATAASAATVTPGNRILNAAEAKTNASYAWGGTGPSSFDCSGLVYWAAGHTGERNWPRDTYGIAAQIGSRFTVTTHPQRGDLALWGSRGAPYHVEFVTIWRNTTYGAAHSGWSGRVNWHDDTWNRPSFYLHVNY